MKTFLKQIALTVIIFVGLFLIAPMVSSHTGTGSCGQDWGPLAGAGNCAPVDTNVIVFPAWRTFACTVWNQPSCATDTFFPGWYDNLINAMNLIIFLVLLAISYFVANRTTARRS